MDKKFLISVIVPVYNVEEYIDECIKSILNQTYEQLELILVNDASTDKSGEKCQRWAAEDSRVVYVSQEQNQGLSATRNKGIDCASGACVLFVDADDYIDPDSLQEMYDVMSRDSEIDMVVANNCVLTQKGEIVYNKEYETEEILGETALERLVFDYKDNSKSFSVMSCNKLIKKELFQNVRFLEGKEFEDTGIIAPLVGKCRKIVIIPDYLYTYRKRPGSITDTITRKSIEDYLANRVFFAEYIENEYPKWKEDVRRVRLSDQIVAYFELMMLKNQNDTKQLKKQLRASIKENRKDCRDFRKKKKLFAVAIIYFPIGLEFIFKVKRLVSSK